MATTTEGPIQFSGEALVNTHTRTIIIIIIILEALICFKTCVHTHTAFHYSSIPYVWLSTENPDLRPESGLNLKDERERLRNEVEDWAEREREHCWKL